MLYLVNTLTLVELTFDIAQYFPEALGSDLVNEPNISLIFYLINELNDVAHARVLLGVQGGNSLEVGGAGTVAPILQLEGKQYVTRIDLSLGRLI